MNTPNGTLSDERARLKAAVRGAVQGVGFRPFVYRLATELHLAGWVNNSPQGVFLEVEGPRSEVRQFLLRLEAERPPHSFIQSLEASWLEPAGQETFEIRDSAQNGSASALVLPDVATCEECLQEVLDPANRRFFYPFTNCTHCGPRYSIIESLPYDRENTSMKRFTMCPQCQAEYDDPLDRRFHAQPNACSACGPRLELWNPDGDVLFGGNDALLAAARAIRRGRIIAVKGIGGFHLVVDATNTTAVRALRERKRREEKPFALMFPSLRHVKAVCRVSSLEERLLRSAEAPIVLLDRRDTDSQISDFRFQISESVAPGNPTLGVMLPYTPLHHLLLRLIGGPVVATSGNLSDEPICTDEQEALVRLKGIADFLLVHDRPIVRAIDDSVVRVMLDRELVLRRARGYAPLPIILSDDVARSGSMPVLAVGAHLKNTVALALGSQVFLSQHIGDLETDEAHNAFKKVINDLERIYAVAPGVIAADLHPDYLSTRYAREQISDKENGTLIPSLSHPLRRRDSAASRMGEGVRRTGEGERASPRGVFQQRKPAREDARPTEAISSPTREDSHPAETEQSEPRLLAVQHHVAHVLACVAENEVQLPALGVAWDGTGYGTDGTVWGGEFFSVTREACERIAHLRTFRLPGGDRAVKEPRRSALGLLFEMFGNAAFGMNDLAPVHETSLAERNAIGRMLERGLNSPITSSAGRLFDAVAALAGLRQRTRYEGQAAMELEFAAQGYDRNKGYPPGCIHGDPFAHNGSQVRVIDWEPMIRALIDDIRAGVGAHVIAARFHHAMSELIVRTAIQFGFERVVLSGGCFQNRILTERTVRGLRSENIQPFWHQRIPPNDGGVALGQVVAAMRAVHTEA